MAASLAIDAVTSADTAPSIASNSAASAPNRGSVSRGASMNPVQNRTGLASASSHDSHAVACGARAAAQLDNSTLLPAPADPTTTVSRWSDPASSRSCSGGLATTIAGSGGGRNFARANRALDMPLRRADAVSTTSLPPPGVLSSPRRWATRPDLGCTTAGHHFKLNITL